MNPLLIVQNLCKNYSGRAVVNQLSFNVRPGEIVGLLGPNGAGKTTAFYMTIGLIAPDQGNVFFQDQDITHTPIHERAKKGMGYLAQEPSIFRHLTVEQNILCILETIEPNKHLRKEKLLKFLQELHLEHLKDKKAATLSGGERRRLEITRALITNPRLLLLDEPFANIDPIAVQDVKKLVKILKNKGISVLITDHNAREIFSLVDRCYLVQEGSVMLHGTPKELLDHPDAREHYLGEDFML